MKIKGIVVAVFAFLTCTGFAQEDAKSIAFVAYWNLGDAYDYKITKVKKQWKRGELSKNDSSSYVARFLVLDSTETSYRIRWTFDTDLGDYDLPEEYEEEFSKYMKNEVVYTTDELGTFQGIENWEEISTKMKTLMGVIMDSYKQKGKNTSAFEKAMKSITNIYSSKEGIEQIVYKELQYFHFPLGVELSTSEPLEYEELLPNMFGGKPIRGDVKLYFEEIDEDEAFCRLIQKMDLNPDDTQELLTTVFKKMNLKSKEIKKMLNEAEFGISDRNVYDYYYYPGVPAFIETVRTSNVNIASEKAVSTEVIRIQLME